MPGIAGIYHPHDPQVGRTALPAMLQAMFHFSVYRLEHHTGDWCSCGRTSRARLQAQIQPTRRGTRWCYLEGNFFNADRLWSALGNVPSQNDGDLVLALYEHYGEQFVERLDGSFSLVVGDESRRELLIATDRFGLHHLYMGWSGESCYFANEAKGVLAAPGFRRSIDFQGAASLVGLGYVLGEATVFDGVKMVAPGTVLVLGPDGVRKWHYGDLKFHTLPDDPARTTDYIEEFGERLAQAMHKGLRRDLCYTVELSGGMDSRTCAAGLRPHVEPLRAFTFGPLWCDDIRYARRVAEQLHMEHAVFAVDELSLCGAFDRVTWLQDGMYSVLGGQGVTVVPQLVNHADVVVSGHGANFLAGGRALTQAVRNSSSRPQLAGALRKQVLQIPPGLADVVEPDVYGDWREATDAAFSDSVRDVRDLAGVERYAVIERIRKRTWYGLQMIGAGIEWQAPFFERDFADFAMALPPAVRADSFAYIQAFARRYPDLNRIGRDGTRLPFTASKAQIEVSSLLGRSLRRLTLPLAAVGIIPQHHPVLTYGHRFVDFGLALRQNPTLRRCTEDYLFCDRTMSRGYWNKAKLRQAFNEHMAGRRDASGIVGSVLTLESIHRVYVDSFGPGEASW